MANDAPPPANMLPKRIEQKCSLRLTLARRPTGRSRPQIQGYFSRTRIVKLVGGEKIVIQFRIQPLEVECFTTTRRLLGDVVPEITELQDEELQALGMRIYAMTYMPGEVWFRVPSSKTEARIQIARSLGTILGRGSIDDQSAAVVDDYILPHLTNFLTRLNDKTKHLQPHVERLIAASAGLKKFPLYFSHHGLNGMNVLVGDDHTVSGIVDWECARALPFGMGLHRITDTIVAENSLGCVDIPDGSKETEKAFWDAVLKEAPKVVLENLEDVQNALHIGALMFAIVEHDWSGPDPETNFLAGVLTYRMPQLRGDSDPFAEEHMPK